MRFGIALVSVLVGVVACGLEVPPNVDKDNDLRRDRGEDNCPNVSNPDQSDFDGDGIGDACDTCDAGEASEDEDRDGIPDACDACNSLDQDDDDADGIPDSCDQCVGNGEDADRDGIPDNCDGCVESGVDADSDGIDDACDSCVGSTADADMDGVEDGCDKCINVGQDSDGDGLVDVCDVCDFGPNTDEDGDSVFDACDNCPTVSNPNQENESGLGGILVDTVGDACDPETIANREIFDGFGAQNPAWYVQGTGWFLQNGAMTVTSLAPTYRSLDIGFSLMRIRTVATATFPQNNIESRIGVYMAGASLQEGIPRVACQVVQYPSSITGPQMRFILWEDNDTFPVEHTQVLTTSTNTYDIQLSWSDESKKVTCSINGESHDETYDTQTMFWYPGIETAGGALAAFNFFDVMTRP